MRDNIPQPKRHVPKPTNFDKSIKFIVLKMDKNNCGEIVDCADISDDAKIKAFNLKSKNPDNTYSVGVVEIIGTI